jgi:hypothetical protein
MEDFWIDDISVLYKNKNYLKFFPSTNYSDIENLNSIARFGIYSSILLSIYNRNVKYLFLYLIPMLITVGIYLFFDINIEKFSNELENTNEYTLPTLNNPMMNVMIGEYAQNDPEDSGIIETRKEAYPVSDNSKEAYYVKKDMENKLNFNLFRDVGDIYNNKHGQRSFYTMPSTTVPNDLNAYLDFVYKKDAQASCKENRFNCMKYDNLKNRSHYTFQHEKNLKNLR